MPDAKPSQDSGKLDDAIDDSFPASDPPSHSGVTSTEPPHRGSKPAPSKGEDTPTGHPTSERHETETAHSDESDQPEKGK